MNSHGLHVATSKRLPCACSIDVSNVIVEKGPDNAPILDHPIMSAIEVLSLHLSEVI